MLSFLGLNTVAIGPTCFHGGWILYPIYVRKLKGRGKWCHSITILKKKNNLKSWILCLYSSQQVVTTNVVITISSQNLFSCPKAKPGLLRRGDGCIIWHLGCASVCMAALPWSPAQGALLTGSCHFQARLQQIEPFLTQSVFAEISRFPESGKMECTYGFWLYKWLLTVTSDVLTVGGTVCPDFCHRLT